jgi:DNA-binding CsgD family transcriptional regulator
MSGNLEHDPHSPDLQGKHRHVSATAIGLFLSAAMMILAACDAALNNRDRLGVQHAIVDECIFLCGLVGIVVTSLRLRRAVQGQQRAHLEATRMSQLLGETRKSLQAKADTLFNCLEQARQEASHWKQQTDLLAAGLGAAIDARFRHWALTPAEREIGHLLLKGLSHKEIAQIREVSEATVRQQAQSLYRKADVAGRNDLAAYFIEDLLQPSASRTLGKTDSR